MSALAETADGARGGAAMRAPRGGPQQTAAAVLVAARCRAALARPGFGARRRARRLALPRARRHRARPHRRARRAAVARPGGVHEHRRLRDRAPGGAGGLVDRGDDPGRRRRGAPARCSPGSCSSGCRRSTSRSAPGSSPGSSCSSRPSSRASPAARRATSSPRGSSRPATTSSRSALTAAGRRGPLGAPAVERRGPPARGSRPSGRGASRSASRATRLLLGAFVASAAVGGLAGSLAVQLAGVSDPNAFGPFTSFKLLVAVLLGGASYAGAGVVGVGTPRCDRARRPRVGRRSRATRRRSSSRCWRACSCSRSRARRRRADPGRPPPSPGHGQRLRSRRPGRAGARPAAAVLTARGLCGRRTAACTRSPVSTSTSHAGETVALVGANGSGKTTALRALCGCATGRRGRDHARRPAARGTATRRCSAEVGVVRTLQRTAIFRTLTALESALVGAGLHCRGRAARCARSRRRRGPGREPGRLRAAALEALRFVGLGRSPASPPSCSTASSSVC